MTQGKCIECSVKYEWDTPQRLHDSYCIICRDKLRLTSCQLHTNESFAYGLGRYYVWHTTPHFIPCNGACTTLTVSASLCGGMR